MSIANTTRYVQVYLERHVEAEWGYDAELVFSIAFSKYHRQDPQKFQDYKKRVEEAYKT